MKDKYVDMGDDDDRDDILDDLDNVEPDVGYSVTEVRLRPSQETRTDEPFIEKEYQRIKTYAPDRVIAVAAGEHEPGVIRLAASKGDVLAPDVDPILTVASGVCVNDLDFAHHQSARGVDQTLKALRDIGVDLNEVRDGEPAAHRVTRYYGKRMVGAYFDTSYQAQIGMTDTEHGSRLAAFAANGVDFTAVNADGERPKDILLAIAREGAKDDRTDPEPALAHVRSTFAETELAARTFRIEQAAQKRADSEAMGRPETSVPPSRRTEVR